MGGEGVKEDRHCQILWCSWGKTLKRRTPEGKPEDFVLIDDDDVIILDFPEPLKQKLKNPGVSRDQSKSPLPGVINIDDDDDDTNNVHQRGIGKDAGDGGELDSNGAPSNSFPAQSSTEVDDDECLCQVIQEKCAAFRFSKCKQTFSRKAASRKPSGSSSKPENCCSESDCSDCEVLDGTIREIRERWEKALRRKKQNVNKAGSGSPNVPKESASQTDLKKSEKEGSGKGSIINNREHLKQTDEYKKAIKAEWESRRQQLRIQAEEARRLRKKRKLEIMRRLEVERRQKLRVEEMRETQKKDEEKMNMKEQFRTEVRKELNKLEKTCIDMASLLRGLGIPVEGGLNPLSHEVHVAYRKAMLKFHPDRASGTDIRQQVEAEEKFKLISRMKEKFSSALRQGS